MSWGGGGSFGGGGGGGSFGGGGGGSMGGGSFHGFDGAQQQDHATAVHPEPATNDHADQVQDHVAADAAGIDTFGHVSNAAHHASTLLPTSTTDDWTHDPHLTDIDDSAFSTLAYPKPIFKTRLSKNQFRLIRLSPSLWNKPLITIHEYTSFSQCPAYTALSWVWGTTTSAYHVKVANYSPDIYVRENCYAALHYLSRATKTGEDYFWIDAICINQSDPVEKAQQVSMMGHIYFQAERIVAYVGEADGTSRALFRQASKVPLNIPSAHDARALLTFTQRPWFHRCWIVQEVLLARTIDLRAGRDVLPWSAFETYHNKVAGSSQQRHSLIHLRQWYTQQAARMLGPLRGEYIRAANMMQDLPPIGALEHSQLYQLMQWTWEFEAGLRRDKIYAMLSLFSEPFPGRLMPDYRARKSGKFKRSDEKIFAALSAFMLQTCDCQMWSVGWKGVGRERRLADESTAMKKARSKLMRVFEPLFGR